ncbi:hypothetical protein Agub_g9295 [Astrephomene gubernaculifera]|uniref:Cupin type-1 domain-containing protein n=1 Tax=Astrephomene gubernaculifera TaxID=47775 RepID=A0AAD3HN57_9CHLO|nr:hypothetical protein Agub_g9295 [Astrephomene gubernaculifera]
MAYSFFGTDATCGTRHYHRRGVHSIGRLTGSSTVGVCYAAAANYGAQQQLPFGGAIVTKLAGSAKLARGEHHVVPLLGPGSGQQSLLPFGASVECFSHDSLTEKHVAPPAHNRSDVLPGTSQRNVATANNARSQMLDVLFVITGTGIVNTADGAVRTLHTGDSLIAWHNTTELQPASSETPPVVLKFHFPASVLLLPPGSTVASMPSHADLQILVDECNRDSPDGELSPQEADDIMRGCALAAAQQPATRTATSVELGRSAPHNASANTVPLPPLLRRLLRTAFSPATQGFRLLRALLGLPQWRQQQQWWRQKQQWWRQQQQAGKSAPTASSGAAAAEGRPGCVLLQRALRDFQAFRFPSQTNRLAFVFDPAELGLSLSLGVEVFEPGHRTPLHIHRTAHELFFVLSGEGVAHCNGQHFSVRAGDCVVFPPLAIHGLDNPTGTRLYCLQLMTPNEAFVEHVKSGEAVGGLEEEDISNLVTRRCC